MMSNDAIFTACHNYLDGQCVGDLQMTTADFMENVVDPMGEDAYADDKERERIEREARLCFRFIAETRG